MTRATKPIRATKGRAHRRRGFSLAEVMVALSIMSVLTVGIASAITIATRALPDERRPADQVVQSARGAQLLSSELGCAKSVQVAGPRIVRFVVPDQTSDGLDETVEYAWSGTPGEPLTRSMNGGAAVAVADDVRTFGLTYTTRTVSQTSSTTAPAQGPETELASFTAWSGISLPTIQNYITNSTSWMCQAFKITVPPGATAVTFTKINLKMRTGDTSGGRYVLSIYRAAGATPAPTGAALVSVNNPTSTLSTTANWTPVSLTNGRVSSPGTDYAIVASGTVANALVAQTYSSALATDNATMFGSSTNSGSTWTMAGNSRDTLFYVYGTFESMQTVTTTTTHTYLTGASVTLRSGNDGGNEVVAAVQALNEPEMP